MTLSAHQTRPLAISLGDPAGISPEIIAKAWQQRETRALPTFCVFGPAICFENIPTTVVRSAEDALAAFETALPVFDMPLHAPIKPGQPDSRNAVSIIAAIDQATRATLMGACSALVTGPIHKAGLYAADWSFQGHTDYLAHLCELPKERAVMMLATEELRVVPQTIHIPLKDVPAALTSEAIVQTLSIMAKDLEDRFGFNNPRIAVSGLNPHAGEEGQIGSEEETIIKPAISACQSQGMQVFGPISADTLFAAHNRRAYDAILAMYHDQALIAVKTLNFREGVNITLGLPIVRTSPDHGTAFDIAGDGTADAESMIQAIIMAARLAETRL